MNKKRNLIPIIVIVVAAAVLISGIAVVNAYMFKKSAEFVNTFYVPKVMCEVNETFADNVKSNVTVKNTGDTDAYIRLRVISYWQDSKGNAVFEGDNAEITISSLGDGWIKASEPNTYYYKKPVKVDESTAELFSGTLTLGEKKKEVLIDGITTVTYTYNQVVEFIAEAIQSNPADAVTESWKVTLDSGGNITSG